MCVTHSGFWIVHKPVVMSVVWILMCTISVLTPNTTQLWMQPWENPIITGLSLYSAFISFFPPFPQLFPLSECAKLKWMPPPTQATPPCWPAMQTASPSPQSHGRGKLVFTISQNPPDERRLFINTHPASSHFSPWRVCGLIKRSKASREILWIKVKNICAQHGRGQAGAHH